MAAAEEKVLILITSLRYGLWISAADLSITMFTDSQNDLIHSHQADSFTERRWCMFFQAPSWSFIAVGRCLCLNQRVNTGETFGHLWTLEENRWANLFSSLSCRISFSSTCGRWQMSTYSYGLHSAPVLLKQGLWVKISLGPELFQVGSLFCWPCVRKAGTTHSNPFSTIIVSLWRTVINKPGLFFLLLPFWLKWC